MCSYFLAVKITSKKITLKQKASDWYLIGMQLPEKYKENFEKYKHYSKNYSTWKIQGELFVFFR